MDGSICRGKSSQSGASASSNTVWPDYWNGQGADDRVFVPPEIVMEVKVPACQLPKDLGSPFSRLTRDEIARQAVARGIVASISGATVWRRLSADAIRPWCYRNWIRPRDPHFEQKAGPVLNLNHGSWQGNPLQPNDYVISADEKTSIQARRRVAPTAACSVGRPGRIEFEYERKGALAYMAGWDVHHRGRFSDCAFKAREFSPFRLAMRKTLIRFSGSSHAMILRVCLPDSRINNRKRHRSMRIRHRIYDPED